MRVVSHETGARLVNKYLEECWMEDKLQILDRKGNIVKEIKGCSSWAFALAPHSPLLQQQHLVVLGAADVQAASAHIPGFADVIQANMDVARRW